MTTAIIGGSGFNADLPGFAIERREAVETRYGAPSGDLLFARAARDQDNPSNDAAPALVFLSRHGAGHAILPHLINYRANLWALQRAGATRVIALCAVGAITARAIDSTLVLPHQIIDYTWGRAHTFFDAPAPDAARAHIVFTHPYSDAARAQLLAAARRGGIDLHDGGVYAATQGPRLETAAEIDRLARDGADLVGMTGMPEASLAREIGLDYAAIAIVVNPAAGRGAEEISIAQIEQRTRSGFLQALNIIKHL